ncbi:MAG: FtsX-like permease family protein [Myxococcaceae bacterium]|nr:FtsX-like permease family protein [Myxococcaceae bacterium]MCI0673003.1 FtsX-like permease family protein [Myxococcaceae bacterium]
MLQLLLIAVRNLAQHRRRTLLLGGAIAGVTALLVMLQGMTTGIRSTLLESATTLSSGHVNVGGFFKVTAGQGAPVVTEFPKLVEIIRKEVPELDFVTERGRGWAKLIADDGSSVQLGLAGVDITRESGLKKTLKVTQGNLDDLAKPGSVLLFEKQATKLNVKVGDALTISAPAARGANNTVDVTVVAVARDIGFMSGFNCFLNGDSLRQLYQLKEDATGALHIYLKDIESTKVVQERLRKRLVELGYPVMDADPRAFWFKFEVVNREEWTGQKLDITNWEDEVSFVNWIITALDGLTYVLIFVLLIIIAVGVMNTLWIAIRERTREIGTLRAIGMQRRRVLLMFLVEALVLGLASTGVGAVISALLAMGLNAAQIPVVEAAQLITMSDTLSVRVTGGSILGAVVFVTTCTTLISLIPSFLAARMKPVTAMHHIG